MEKNGLARESQRASPLRCREGFDLAHFPCVFEVILFMWDPSPTSAFSRGSEIIFGPHNFTQWIMEAAESPLSMFA